MDDATPTLLLTRPVVQSRAFLLACEAALGARIPAVIAPLLKIVEVGDLPDLDRYATIVVTSAHAVHRLVSSDNLRGRKLVCVGEATADLARSHGAVAASLGTDVVRFLENADKLVSPCIYLRGRHISTDLVSASHKVGVQMDEAIVYDQVAQPMSRAGDAVLCGGTPVIAPLFSARTAELLSRSVGIGAQTLVIAMSERVAASWYGGGQLEIVSEPTSAAICEAVIQRYS